MFPAPGVLDLALYVIFSAVLWIGIPLGIFVFLRRFLRAYERRAAAPSDLHELRFKIQALQGQVADLTIENDRLRQTRGAEGSAPDAIV